MNVEVPVYVLVWFIVVGSLVAWSLIGAVVAGMLRRYGYEGDGELSPPPEVLGAVWPLTCTVLLVWLACYVSKWTLFLPARMLYKVISGER